MAESSGQDLLVALKHPLRRRILRILRGAGGPISPRQLSQALAEPLANVGYHVRVLKVRGAIELVDETPVRGSLQHFYVFRIEEPWALALLEEDDGDAG